MTRFIAYLSICLGLLLLETAWFLAVLTAELPSYSAIKQETPASDVVLLDRHYQLLGSIRQNFEYRKAVWTSYAQIPTKLITAVIAQEDRRFYQHFGVDGLSLLRELKQRLWREKKSSGASTITMQTIGLLPQSLIPVAGKRNLLAKIQQMLWAIALELKWSKQEILTFYLNNINVWGEDKGVQTSAARLFGKSLSYLTTEEAVLWTALLPKPGHWNSAYKERACKLWQVLQEKVDCKALEPWLVRGPRDVNFYTQENIALHAGQYALKNFYPSNKRPKQIHLQLDQGLQNFAMEQLNDQLLRFQSERMNGGAVLVVENSTGNVLAYVGNSFQQGAAKFVDLVQAKRQAGSTLKPFLYELALAQKLITPQTLLFDLPMSINVGAGSYRPKNFDNRYSGVVAAQTALASSLNVPAVNLLAIVGVERFYQRLVDLGFTGLETVEYYGPSMALGSVELSLWDLVNAYRTLANRGRWSPLQLLTKQVATVKSHRVLTPESSYLISKILASPEQRQLAFGLESVLGTSFWSAVKTGTSQDMRDNWCVGYSQQYTVGVWMGNVFNQPMKNVSGVSGAAPLWRKIMEHLHKNSKENMLTKVPQNITTFAGAEFIAGTEPNNAKLLRTAIATPVKINNPEDGSVFSVDPDIPVANQKIWIEAKGNVHNTYWWLNGKKLEQQQRRHTSIAAKQGSYTLQLRTLTGTVLDQVSFLVK